MTDDLLAQMTSALADEHDGSTAMPEATRARVVRTLAERRPRRRKWWVVGVPAFVLFGGSTAWAAATGQLPQIVEKAVAVLTGSEVDSSEDDKLAASPRARGATGRGQTSTDPTPAVDAPEEDVEEEEVIEDEAETANSDDAGNASDMSELIARDALAQPQPQDDQKTAASQGSTSHEAKEPVVEEDNSALATYRVAHRAQFQSGDCVAAVSGYDSYINEAPSGSFILEAKYNRAVCLAKMGRSAEAERALSPFAKGSYGGYRQQKAQALIDALRSKSTP